MKRERAEKLFHLFGEIDDELILEADEMARKTPIKMQGRQRKNMMRFVGVAASFIVLGVGIWAFVSGQQDNQGDMAAAPEMDNDWVVDDMSDDDADEDAMLVERPGVAEEGDSDNAEEEMVESEMEETVTFEVQIVEIHTESQPTDSFLFGHTILAVGVGEITGNFVFNHLELPDIGVFEGAVVTITVHSEWPLPDPIPLSVISWELYE